MNQEAPPAIEVKDEEKKSDKKEEIPNKNEIITEKPKEETIQKEEKKIEKPKEEIQDKNEIIINEAKKETEKNEIKTNEPKKEINPPKKDRLKMDEFEKFMDKYPENLIGKFEFDFYGDTLKPDCVFWRDGRKYYVYFNLGYLRNKLDEKWQYIFKNYPENLADLKEPLEQFRSAYRKNQFKEDWGIFQTVYLGIKFIFSKEKYNEEVRKRAEALAYLLAQIEHRKKQDFTTIGMIDSINLKIDFFPFEIFDTINTEIDGINIKRDTIEQVRESLNFLSQIFNSLNDKIDNNFGDNDKKILKSYLANRINPKLSLVEDYVLSEDSEDYQKRKSLRNKLNYIITINMDKEANKSFFFDEEKFQFKIIKDTNNEKFILLNSVYMKKFYTDLVEIFVYLRDFLLQFDDDDIEINPERKNDFIRKHMNKFEDLEKLDANIKKEINKTRSKMAKQGIDLSKNSVEIFKNLKNKNLNVSQNANNAVDNLEKIANYNIDKILLEKTENIIFQKKEETIKLIKEFDLMEKLKFIDDKRFKENTINGILIARKIKNPKNPLTDRYEVYLI